MSLLERLQKEKEIQGLQQRNKIDSVKLKVFRQIHQSLTKKLKHCPYYGRPLS